MGGGGVLDFPVRTSPFGGVSVFCVISFFCSGFHEMITLFCVITKIVITIFCGIR